MMPDAMSLVQTLYELGKLVYDQVQKVKANKNQCQRLGERILIVVDTLNNTQQIQRTQQFVGALQHLHTLLTDCQQFITQFNTQDRHFLKKFLGADRHEEAFKDLNRRLERAIHQLNLGLNVQQVMDKQQDEQDRLADLSYLMSQQQALLAGNQALQGELGIMHMEQKEGLHILHQQIASIQLRLQDLQSPKKAEKFPFEERYLVPFYSIQFAEVIDKGSFGTVYKAKHQGRWVAVKRLEGPLSPAEKAEFMQEAAIMSRLMSNEITQLFGVCVEENRYCLIMEYMDKGSLTQYLKNERPPMAIQHRLILEIARGLYYLHSNQVLHRDLKSGNILINGDYHAKLSDFGLSFAQHKAFQSLGKQSQAIAWLAPEVLRGDNYTQAADIYSYGVLVWEIVTGRQPFADQGQSVREQQALALQISQGLREEIAAHIPSVYAHIIRACWHSDPTKRPGLEAIIHQLENYQPDLQAVPRGLTTQWQVPGSSSPAVQAEEYYQRGLKAEQQQDLVNAVKHYQNAVALNHTKAKTNLGFCHLKGLGGLTKNSQRAHQLFLEAANAGHARAQSNLGTMLERGDGIPVNIAHALGWYQKAAAQGDPIAQKRVDALCQSSQPYAENLMSLQNLKIS